MARAKKQQEAAEEAKPLRPLQQIEEEYKQLCQQAGDRNYRKAVLEMEIAQLHQRMFQLNQEASQHQQAPEAPEAT